MADGAARMDWEFQKGIACWPVKTPTGSERGTFETGGEKWGIAERLSAGESNWKRERFQDPIRLTAEKLEGE